MALDFDNIVASLALPGGGGSWTGHNIDLDYRRVFGGQILAQTVAALSAAEPAKSIKSFTQYFPREGDMDQDLTYGVRPFQNGRTFGTFGVHVTQGEKVVSSAMASLHVPETGLEAQITMTDVGTPEDATPVDLGMIPWECRAVGGIDLTTRESLPPRYSFWTRTPDVTGPAWHHQALLAYATDLTVIGTALLPVEGYSQADTGIKLHTAVTTHTIWFHREFRVDDWLLISQTSPVLTGGRAFGRGDAWTEDGQLVASFAQEAMVRLIP